MKKTGILLFVIVLAVALFGCKKSKNVDFEKSIEELKQRNHLVFLPKNNKNGFDVFETLEGKLKSGVREFGVIYTFSDEELNEDNQLVRKCFNYYLQHKFESYRDSTTKILLYSSKFFSMIEVLNSTAQDSTLANDIQFSEIINQLDGIPYYFYQAKKIIKKPTKENLENAILQYSQDYFYLKNELPLLLRKPDILKADQINFSKKNQEAQLAVKDFIAFLNSHLFELSE